MKYLFWIVLAFIVGVVYGFDGADQMWRKVMAEPYRPRRSYQRTIDHGA